jgi:hypothetical protein
MFYGHLEYFTATWYNFTNLVNCTKKSLATPQRSIFAGRKVNLNPTRGWLPDHGEDFPEIETSGLNGKKHF